MIITLVRDPWYRVSRLGRSILLIARGAKRAKNHCHSLDFILRVLDSCGLGEEVMLMTTAEEIVVSGENFIERRIFVQPEEKDIAAWRDGAYRYGYRRGWARGFVMGLALVAMAILSAWVIVH